MADVAALYSLISGIGGALIGGVAAVYGPGRIDGRRRAHELRIESERRRSEAEARERAADAEERQVHAENKQRVLKAIADATVALQDWHRLVTRTLQDLEAGRVVDVDLFDEAAEPVMHSVVQAISLAGNESFRSVGWSHTSGAAEDGDRGRPVTLAMQQVTLGLRRHLLAPQTGFDALDGISARVDAIRDDLMNAFEKERTLRVGPPPAVGYGMVMARPH
ncbi:hypothetical protein [Streptomyces sulfonofaciens]|nr:hypothetical protein [Streptomyces sulfonofaciens]